MAPPMASRHEAITAYTAEMAGAHLDLDADLLAGIEHLVNTGKAAR